MEKNIRLSPWPSLHISSFSQLSILISDFMTETTFLIHLFTQQTFVTGLLCARPWARCWEWLRVQNQTGPLLTWTAIKVGRQAYMAPSPIHLYKVDPKHPFILISIAWTKLLNCNFFFFLSLYISHHYTAGIHCWGLWAISWTWIHSHFACFFWFCSTDITTNKLE